MSKIRLAAFDFDGTLVPKDIPNLDLETDIVALLQKLRQQGDLHHDCDRPASFLYS